MDTRVIARRAGLAGLVALAAVGIAWAAPTATEHQLKAAFIHNFIKFVDWPADKLGEEGKPIVVGIIGLDPLRDALDVLASKPAKNRKLVVQHFEGLTDPSKEHPQISQLRTCHVLFVCASEKDRFGPLLNSIERSFVLTVGDVPGFVDRGGMINFVTQGDKILFEVNLKTARKAGLTIRSQLLRLALRVEGQESQ